MTETIQRIQLIATTDPDVAVTQVSNRAFAVECPLGFAVDETSGAETNCAAGHVHARRYRITTSIPGIPGTLEFDDEKCFTTVGPNEFVAECDGRRGATCPADGIITGRFIYEGVTKPFAITNSTLCRCDNLHHPTCPCGANTLCNECDTTIYGQDENWVRNNFDRFRGLDPDLDDADDILRYGYASWVDRRVVYGNFENHWIETMLSVTARLRGGAITSQLNFCFGDDDYTQPVFSVSAPEVVFLNDDDRTSRWYRVRAALTCPVATNATVSFMNSQTTLPVYSFDPCGANRISLSDFTLSTSPSSPVDARIFYMACEKTGSGSVFASCALENGGTLSDSATYQVIEPLRKLVCTNAVSNGGYYNPPRLVYGTNAWLQVSVNGDFLASEVEWRIVSGPGRIVVTNGLEACVEPTSSNGEVVVEAAFGHDSAIQPRFVLPVGVRRVIPIRAFVVCSNGVSAVSFESVRSKLATANHIFSQLGIEFSVAQITALNVSSTVGLDVPKYDYVTNVSGRVLRTLSDRAKGLLDTYSSNDIEWKWVKE